MPARPARKFEIQEGFLYTLVQTEAGAHTLALNRKKIYAFLPQSRRAAVFVDSA
jgi:hypothetical protein